MIAIYNLGKTCVSLCEQVGISGCFLIKILFSRFKFTKAIHYAVEQIYKVGLLSLTIILVSALFIGMVVSLQGFNVLEKFGATQALGQMIALSILRELGPVITALLFVGRACSSLTAEIGLMRATKQLDYMEVMSVDPIPRIISPRFFAGFISLPLLTLMFDVIAIYGGAVVGIDWLGVDGGAFWSNIQSAVHFTDDVLESIIKSIVFGFCVTWVALYQGYYSEPTAAGISRATTKTVVYSSLLVLILDFILSSFMILE